MSNNEITTIYLPIEWVTEIGLSLTSIIPPEMNFTIGVYCADVTYTLIEDDLL